MHEYPSIFSAGRIGRLETKNRLVLAPMVRNYADGNGHATARYVAHIERIARGGVGTVILEAAYVRSDGRGFRHQLGLHEDGAVRPLRAVVEAAHRHDALVGIQLFHGGRQAAQGISGRQPVAPSAIPDPLVNELPRELDGAEIGAIAYAFGAAARRARSAGCDFVEIHGAHGYLVCEFLSPYSNRRTDAYGGSPENRRRFLEEIYACIRGAVGADFPITLRLSGEEDVPGGLTIADTVATARRMEQLGAAAVHVSADNYAAYPNGRMIPPMAVDDGVLLPLAAKVTAAVGIPVIAVGKLRAPALVEKALREHVADFVALGRSLLADPDWPAKLASGRAAEIRHCIACNQGCISRLFEQNDVWCTINPEAGREIAFSELHGGRGRKIVVAGAGPAGMAAAIWGARAGFEIELYEREDELGGQLLAASVAPHRGGWDELNEHMKAELARSRVHVHLRREALAGELAAARPWAIVVATGARPVRPEVAGAQGMPVVTGRDVLEGRVAHQGHVVVVGGNCAGAQTAEYLASCGHAVTLIEAEGDIAVDAPVADRHLLLGRLVREGVALRTHTRLLGIGGDHVIVRTPTETVRLEANMVVLCLGAAAVDDLVAPLRAARLRVRTVGDALGPRRVTDAVAEGALAVLGLLHEAEARGEQGTREIAAEPPKGVRVYESGSEGH